MDLVSTNQYSPVEWMRGSLAAERQQPLTWHKVCDEENVTFNSIERSIEFVLMPLNVADIL